MARKDRLPASNWVYAGSNPAGGAKQLGNEMKPYTQVLEEHTAKKFETVEKRIHNLEVGLGLLFNILHNEDISDMAKRDLESTWEKMFNGSQSLDGFRSTEFKSK